MRLGKFRAITIYRLYIDIADGMVLVRLWTCRYSKGTPRLELSSGAMAHVCTHVDTHVDTHVGTHV